jgi:hypothetical protein
MQQPPSAVRTVAIPFADLKVSSACGVVSLPFRFGAVVLIFSDADFGRRRVQDRGKDLSGKIEEGLGPNGLGIISISDVSIHSGSRLPMAVLTDRAKSLSVPTSTVT